ncbi:MAG TPA: hypothetical protein VN737_21495 [Bryobacteraceae bacterium]|jgi:hypothetical protein|nr:hypothetical protein [Bryobacteraceae bacterium]
MIHFSHLFRRSVVFLAVLLGAGFSVLGASADDPEDFRIEVTGDAWILNTAGHIQSGSLPIDLKGDLGVEENKPTFLGRFVLKPARRHRIILEGTPYTLDGRNQIVRSIVYNGQTFNVSDTVVSKASLDYLFAGYQYDVISNPRGHLGFEVGGAYLSADGSLHGLASGVTASKSQTIGLPLVGTEFRVFPVPASHLFELNGEVKGMALGDYGHYLQADLNAGLQVKLITFEAGYRFVDANVHQTGASPSGVSPRFKGIVAGLVFRY